MKKKQKQQLVKKKIQDKYVVAVESLKKRIKVLGENPTIVNNFLVRLEKMSVAKKKQALKLLEKASKERDLERKLKVLKLLGIDLEDWGDAVEEEVTLHKLAVRVAERKTMKVLLTKTPQGWEATDFNGVTKMFLKKEHALNFVRNSNPRSKKYRQVPESEIRATAMVSDIVDSAGEIAEIMIVDQLVSDSFEIGVGIGSALVDADVAGDVGGAIMEAAASEGVLEMVGNVIGGLLGALAGGD